ncbi:UbiX family flavin prenyltransferase [Caminibacter pacificus]|uniref:4-hydroxy-3-polyprenylbenzoate decarboxylase n=1 Tax=Caminibacter pacificus TaxID=1424653 RepID=A0AAJ4RDC1_9BACT|nr:UbiX family flavin prenyltransferase [Caminibacter pacificus]NPA88361.1 UbiX family flavin prenyltransferase [Campylobacterota bacterium]QCI28508.1 UbiX family flavin prenyltransferase [Caminibacter pacificus]ROR40767.1 4-hydroxy-3-polyprenylbenzoate decarboxylase [Caminibacter pacificus]
MKKILVCISGASGASLGLKLYSLIPPEYERFLVLSEHAKIVLEKEENIFLNDDIAAAPASGSFGIDVTFIVPCSMNTLAKIALGIADNLITRAAQVAIKEKKKLIIAPREMPFSEIYLEHMLKLSKLQNVIIAPPVIAYYNKPETIDDIEKFLIGKWFDLAGIDNKLFKRWK